MTQQHKDTARWIGIILAMLVSVSGWLYASVIHIKVSRAEEIVSTVNSHTKELGQLETKIAVLDTNIIYIKQTLTEIKQLIEKNNATKTIR